MTPCLCELCRPGDPAPTYTEAHRLACEARFLLAMPSKEHRQEFYRKVAEKRGAAAMQYLMAAVKSEYERKQHANQVPGPRPDAGPGR